MQKNIKWSNLMNNVIDFDEMTLEQLFALEREVINQIEKRSKNYEFSTR